MGLVEIPLHFLQTFPGSLQGLEAHQVRQVFPDPAIIEIEGRRPEPLFLSFLLHGNETTSFFVLQKLQKYLQDNPSPRRLILFVGNVYATEQQRRFLPDQQDYNRVWLDDGDTLEHRLAHRVQNYAKGQGPLFASIDIHNNTGANPFYACVNHLEDSSVYLGSLFSRTLVYFQNPNNAQSVVFSKLCPSVTLECGQSGQQAGVEKAFQFILDVMHLESLEHHQTDSETSIFETVGRMVLKNIVDYDFGFSPESATLVLPEDFEKLNFGYLETGSLFAEYQGHEAPFHVYNDQGQDTFDEFFTIVDNEIRVKQPVVPSMFTKNVEVIRQDCLGYIMKQVR